MDMDGCGKLKSYVCCIIIIYLSFKEYDLDGEKINLTHGITSVYKEQVRQKFIDLYNIKLLQGC